MRKNISGRHQWGDPYRMPWAQPDRVRDRSRELLLRGQGPGATSPGQEAGGGCRVGLLETQPFEVMVYWEAEPQALASARGRVEDPEGKLVLRIGDASVVHEGAGPASFDVGIEGLQGTRFVKLENPFQTIRCELGVLGRGGRFSAVARSNVAQTPRDQESDLYDESSRTLNQGTVPPHDPGGPGEEPPRYIPGPLPEAQERDSGLPELHDRIQRAYSMSPPTIPALPSPQGPAPSAGPTAESGNFGPPEPHPGPQGPPGEPGRIPPPEQGPGSTSAGGPGPQAGDSGTGGNPGGRHPEASLRNAPYFPPPPNPFGMTGTSVGPGETFGAIAPSLFPFAGVAVETGSGAGGPAGDPQGGSGPEPGSPPDSSGPLPSSHSVPTSPGARKSEDGLDLELHADLVIYGRARPGMKVYLSGSEVMVRGDGTFEARFALPPAEEEDRWSGPHPFMGDRG